jgi:4-amino-4-deoxy-L-arabinose transferase-like glycosyltransferase
MLRQVPAAAWICALVACLSAASWSYITPPFQVPDEPDHFAYVKQLAETGSLPTSGRQNAYTDEERFALEALRYEQLRQDPSSRALFSRAEQRNLDASLAAFNRTSERGSSNVGSAFREPPLYYALQSIPYSLGSGGTLLDRLQLMRLFSALMAGFTALFTFLFLRETLPRTRWAWTVGTLCVALSPLFGFMSGALNPDALLFAVSAALFYCVARAFRRGFTTRSAIVTGVVIAVGFLTKLNFVGLAPGAFLALGILAVRGARSSGRGALRAAAIAAAIGCIPVVVFLASNAAAHQPAFGIISDAIRITRGSPLDEANYIWQFYLPRLPGTVNDFTGLSTTRQLWFDGYVGRFGWLDTFFPGWVYTAALLTAGLIAGLCARGLLAARAALRGRASELAVYALMTLGVLVLVGADSYNGFQTSAAGYAQARYLLPMLPLLAAVLALAARGAGRRWGPPVGALIVVLFLAHDIFGQLQVIARYYG